MEVIVFEDNMKEESNQWRHFMVLYYALAVLFPFVLIWNDLEVYEIILTELLFIFVASFFLYAYLSCLRYQVVVYEDKIVLKTLFKQVEINFKDVTSCTCKRHMKSPFYQFAFLCNDKKIPIYTRYKEKLEEILRTNKIHIDA